MAVHIRDLKSISIPTAVDFVERYAAAREKEVPPKQSKQYAHAALETVRQGSRWLPSVGGPRMTSSTWYKGVKYDSETYDRLVKGALGTVVTPNRGSKVYPAALAALRDHRPKVYSELIEAMHNYNAILGFHATRIDFLERFAMIKEWVKIKRGRDLFVPGFGGFDIKAAANSSEPIGIGHYVVPVNHIRQVGYRIPVREFFNLMDRKKFFREFVIRHVVWVRRNPNVLDEIMMDEQLARIRANPDIHPTTILIQARREREQRAREYERMRAEGNIKRIAEFQGEFDNLEKYPVLNTEFGILRPLRSGKECVEVGEALHNCADGYIRHIQTGTVMLICLFEWIEATKSEKPIALGELYREPKSLRWTWGQILGTCNTELKSEVKRVFQRYPVDLLNMGLTKKKGGE